MSRLKGYIEEEPEAVLRLLDHPPPVDAVRAAWDARPIRKVWIAGSGTSLFAAQIAAEIWESRLGVDVEAIGSLPFLEAVDRMVPGEGTAVVGISQTGATNVLVEAVARARARGALTIACTAFPEAPLARAAELVLDSRTGPENTPGKTKGFVTTTAAVGLVGLALADRAAEVRQLAGSLAERLRQAVAEAGQRVDDWVARLAGVQALWVAGTGRLAPAAVEGALKILEVAKLPVVGKELEEMMHGQFHAIGPGCGIVFLGGATGAVHRVADFRRVVEAVGVPLVALAEPSVADAVPGHSWDYRISCDGAAPFAALVGAVPLQLLAEALARARGLDPDQPRYPDLYRISGSKSIYARAPGQGQDGPDSVRLGQQVGV